MKLLEWLRKAAPLGLPVLASIAAVVLLAESYSVSAKLENYERLRADHRSLITTVAEKRRDADEASANLARVTGDLNAANEGIRRISAERESALKETAEARAAHAFTDEQRRQIEERKTALQTDIETNEKGRIESGAGGNCYGRRAARQYQAGNHVRTGSVD